MQDQGRAFDWRSSRHAVLVHAGRAEILRWIERRRRFHGERSDRQAFLVVDIRGAVGREVAVPIIGELEVRRRTERAARAHAPPA